MKTYRVTVTGTFPENADRRRRAGIEVFKEGGFEGELTKEQVAEIKADPALEIVDAADAGNEDSEKDKTLADAHAEAESIKQKADEDAAAVADEAKKAADKTLADAHAEAEKVLADAEAEAQKVSEKAEADAKAQIEAAQKQADDILAKAKQK